MKLWNGVAIACLATAGLVACDGEDAAEDGAAETGGTGGDDGDTGSDDPFNELREAGLDDYFGRFPPTASEDRGDYTQYEWAPNIAEGPMCYTGEPFRMATRPGTSASDELIIYLQGGGACWSTLCQAFTSAPEGIPEAGLLARDLEGNPTADWDVAYVNYCDGSVFTGDNDIDDDDDGEIDRYHRGLQNFSASLDVIKVDFPNPSRVVLVGASAGAYGTIWGATLVRTTYPDVDMVVVADAGLGLGKPDDVSFITGVLGEWNINRLIPESCENCTADGHATQFVEWVLERDPKILYLGISSLQDVVIGTIFLGLGGPGYEAVLLEETAEAEADSPGQYFSYLFPGDTHTVVGGNNSLTLTQQNGITVSAWLSAHLSGDSSVGSVAP